MKQVMAWVLAAGLGFLASGCATSSEPTKDGTIAGAAVGAGLGAVLGHNLGDGGGNDRAIGAAAGALAGGALGHSMGRNEQNRREIEQIQRETSTVTVWITNSNGSRTPVQLRKADGGQYVGPRGEFYPALPTEAQLRTTYGF